MTPTGPACLERVHKWATVLAPSLTGRAGCRSAPTLPRFVEAVVRPTLAEWVEKDPENPEPRFWLALYDKSPWQHVCDALCLDPAYGPACGVKIELILAAVDYDQHELPSGYLDDPEEDLIYLCEPETLAVHVDDRVVQAAMLQRIALFRKEAED